MVKLISFSSIQWEWYTVNSQHWPTLLFVGYRARWYIYYMILYRYIIKEHVLPFLYSFCVIVFFLMMNQVVQLLEKVITKGLEPSVVLELFLIQLGWIIALAVPMAILVSTLTTFGKMSADNEILAIKASGRSIFHLMTPVLVASVLMAIMLIYFNNLILPDANHHAANLFRDISRKKPAAFIEPRVLIKDFKDYVLYTHKVDPKSGKLEQILIFSDSPDQDPSTTIADSGYVSVINNGEYLLLQLFDGETHSLNREKEGEHRVAHFKKQSISIPNVDSDLHRSENSYRGDREKSAQIMLNDVKQFKENRKKYEEEFNAELDRYLAQLARDSSSDSVSSETVKNDTIPTFEEWAQSFRGKIRKLITSVRKDENKTARIERKIFSQRRKINQYLVEVHKKYSIPVTAIVFVLIGAPLGIMSRGGGLAVGIAYSVFFFILFWATLIGGESLADRLIISPALAMWTGPAVVGFFGVFLVIRMIRETTFISFGPLIKIWRTLVSIKEHQKLFPRFVYTILGGIALILKSPFILLRRAFKILPVYLLRKFFFSLLSNLLIVLVIFVVIDFVSNLRRFEDAPFNMIALYYLYFLPWITQTVLPIVILLSAMFAMGGLAKHSELTAMRSAGINIRQLTTTVLLFGMLLAGLSFYFGERILPDANQRRKQIKEDMQEGRSATPTNNRNRAKQSVFKRNFYYFGNEQTIYCFEEFRTHPQRTKNVWQETFEENRILRRIQAKSLKYIDSVWYFIDGSTRLFNGDTVSSFQFDTLQDSILSASPEEMVVRIKSKEEMSYWELKSFIDKVRKRGEKVSQYTAELYFKIALPVMNFIVILLGISIAARMKKKGGAVFLGVGLFMTFAYWIIARFALAFAQNDQLPPIIGAWFGNILFFIIGLILFRKASH